MRVGETIMPLFVYLSDNCYLFFDNVYTTFCHYIHLYFLLLPPPAPSEIPPFQHISPSTLKLFFFNLNLFNLIRVACICMNVGLFIGS